MIILTFSAWFKGTGPCGANYCHGPEWRPQCAIFDTEDAAREWINELDRKQRLRNVAIFHPPFPDGHEFNGASGGAFYDLRTTTILKI